MDDSFEVLLTSDHDFDLFKHMRFLPSQQIWIEPQIEDKEEAVRRLLPKEAQIEQSLLLESESVEFHRGEVKYNSAYNWRYFRQNIVAIGMTACTIVYVSSLYSALKNSKKTSVKKSID